MSRGNEIVTVEEKGRKVPRLFVNARKHDSDQEVERDTPDDDDTGDAKEED